jgi:hypothetical protein
MRQVLRAAIHQRHSNYRRIRRAARAELRILHERRVISAQGANRKRQRQAELRHPVRKPQLQNSSNPEV